MRKIPTLFVRDPEDMSRVLPVVHPDCAWVLAGEGEATRKFDGTCVMLEEYEGERTWWARREVKPGKTPPHNFRPIEHDRVTGKTVGWEPIEQSGWAKYLAEAVVRRSHWETGTYELCGPRINKNPEQFTEHVLVKHADAERHPWYDDLPTDPAAAYEYLRHELQDSPHYEGVVWHHPDGRMAKLKRKDMRP